jgi:restriction system protein
MPIMKCLKDEKEHSFNEIMEYTAKELRLTEAECLEQIPSGASRLTTNISWAISYLSKPGLIERVNKRTYKITDKGVKIIKSGQMIDKAFVEQLYDFKADKKKKKKEGIENETPTEQFEHAFKQINEKLADELLMEIMKQTPYFFEQLVLDLLKKMGYGGAVNYGTVTKKSGDEGIDGNIREDKLGFGVIYYQAKRWELKKTVSRPEIQKFVGALSGIGATKGLFVTTAAFTNEARQFAKSQHSVQLVLVDGEQLAELMIEFDLGVSTEKTYDIKKLDSDYFYSE